MTRRSGLVCRFSALFGVVYAGWTRLDTTGGYTGRDEAGYFVWQDRMCLFGGRGSRPVECLDAVENAWNASSVVTQDLHHVQPVEFKGKFWIVAAWNGTWPSQSCCPDPSKAAECPCGERDLTHSLVYDPVGDALHVGCPIPEDFARGGAGVAVWEDHIYVVNGAKNGHQRTYGGRAFRGLSRFNPVTCDWQDLGVSPRFNRDHFFAAVLGSKLFILGGRDSPRSDDPALCCHWHVEPVEWIDLAAPEQGWQQGAHIPRPVAGYTLVVDEAAGLLIVIGGESDYNKPDPMPSECVNASGVPGGSVAHRDVQVYDVNADTWEAYPSLLTGRHTAGGALVTAAAGETKLVVAAGVSCTGGALLLEDTEALAYPPSLAVAI